MKKFAKILGFLGFFVTLATAQIGTAWAVKCDAGFYWSGEYKTCKACPGHTFINGVEQGVYCPGGDFNGAGYDEGLYGCRNSSCGTTSFWLNTPVSAQSKQECTGGCQGLCLTPAGCNSEDGCYPITDWVNGSATCSSGTGVCTITTQCETVECKPELCEYFNGTACVPNVNKNIQYRCTENGSPIGFGDDEATYGQEYVVTGPSNGVECAAPGEGQEFKGWILTNNNNSGPYMPGTPGATIASWPCVSDPVIFVASFFGCPADQYLNEETGECKPCDTASGFHSQPGSVGEHSCQKSCVGECWMYDNPQQYHSCGTGETGQYISSTIPGTQYEDWGNGCYYADNQNALIPDTDVADQECHWECGCSEPCYEEVDGSCKPKKWTAYYDCNDGSSVYADPNQPESYGVYWIAHRACVSEGQTFLGWTLDSGGHVYNYNDPSNNRLTWSQCADQTFKPVFEDTCYEVSFNDETNGGHPNGYPASTPGTHGPFYKKYNDPNHIWYSDNKCSEESKLEIGSGVNQVNVIGHLPWKEHATFTGYYYENPTPDRQIFNANGNLTTGNNSGSDWTITGDTVLYAQYTCDEGYTPNDNGDCVGDKIDVKYTCVSPIESEPYTRTFDNDATYGTAYLVKSVGTGNHDVLCPFTGYELDNNYVWNLQDYSGNSNNPNGEYGPGADAGNTLLSTDWQYLPTPPLTEIEFVLDKSLWHLKTYNVEYRCGTINNTQVLGGPVTDSVTYNAPYFVAHDNILTDFLERCDETLDGAVSGYTLQDWTFTCDDQSYGNFNTGDPIADPNAWTYDSNNCYFTANWAQTDFVIILDQNGGTDGDPSDYLYTRKNNGVYLDSARTLKMLPDHESDANPLTPPQKTINITIYPDSTHDGTGASFTYNGTIYGYNGANNYANIDENLDFMGYYQNITSNPEKYIDPYEGKGYITGEGIAAGKTYDENYNVSQRTWVAHWGTYELTLPSTATWIGHDFAGWTCVDGEGNNVQSCNANQSCQVQVSENITCTAQWSVACRSVSFDDTTNGEPNSPTNGGNNNRFSKVSGVGGWYGGTECGGTQITPSVVGRIPTKTNGHFIGYNTAVDGTGNEIFNVNGTVTDYGRDTWAPVDNATLYAQYACDDLYHLNPQTGNCEMCPAGSFYDSDAGACKTCNEILQPLTGISGWTSKEGYTWSIDQCYRNCGTDGNDNVEKCDAVNMPSGHGFEQFVAINDGTGRQISFYGNEQEGIYTCRSATGATKCPLGLLNSNDPSAGPQKPMAAAVKFNNIATGENALRYIIGNRAGSSSSLSLDDGFAWSQVVGAGQQGPENTTGLGTYHYTFITYPADTAPAAISREHQTFVGYGYPETGESQLVNASNLTENNANNIIQFAKNLDPAQNNMSPNTQPSYSRNLWPIYTDDQTYTLTYSCGEGGGTPPASQSGIYAGYTVSISVPSNCSHHSTHLLREWAVTGTESEQNLGTVAANIPSFSWEYTQNVTFTAVWGSANTHSIIYNKIPTTNGNITPNGNTLVRPNASTMPTQFECDNEATNITGQPQLKNSDDVVIGTVIKWCKDSDLEDCYLPLELQNSNCTDKNVYAKWECMDPRYHLNENKDDCVVCNAGEYWDANDQDCKSCSAATGENFPYSTPGFNWSVDQCYSYCASNLTCTDTSFSGIYTSEYANCQFTKINDTDRQIEFYGNYRTNVTACDGTVEYCAYGFAGCGTPDALFKPVTVQVDFKKNTDEIVGQRYIFGSRSGSGNNIDVNPSTAKIWSQIVGQGQQEQVSGGNYSYTHIIYPTYTAPAANQTGQDFTGYYYPEDDGTRYVEYDLGLDDTNAQSVLQSQPGSISASRSLFAKYCSNGQEWNGYACIGTDYDVKYVCNGEVVATDRATYDHTYTVLNHNNLTGCTAPDGKVFVGWGFSDNGSQQYLEDYDDGEEFIWQYTVQQPTFTAIWDDGCYAVLINNTEFGGADLAGYSTPYVQFYKKGLYWYTSWNTTCSENTIPNPTISALPTIGNGSFAGYDIDNSSQNLSSSAIFQFNNVTNNAVVSSYGQNNWTITDDTTLYAKYTCDSNYTMQLVDGVYVCIQNGPTPEQYHIITLNKNVEPLRGDDSDPTVLYTIEGDTTVYKNVERTEPFSRLDENPKKYAYVKFNFCDGDNNSCGQPSTENVTKNAYFTFGGFYELHPDVSDRYISADGFITRLGGNVAAGLANDKTWYAVWNDYGTVARSDWQSDPTPPSGYAFDGWYTERNCVGTQITDDDHFTADTDLYACWSQNAFTVTYNCGIGQPLDSYVDADHPVTTGGTYTVLANGAVPNGQGGFVTCNLSGQGFNGWKFSGNDQTYTGGAGSQVAPWTYGNETMTAQYRTCNSNEVLVDGVCYSTCSVSCVIPSGLQSNGCPVHDPVYPNPNNPNDPDGVRCEYVSQTIGGYDNGDGNCRYISSEDDHEQGDIIPQFGDCRYNVTCNNTSLEWNSDPNVWACVWPSGTVWTVTFKCDVNDSVTTYDVTVPGTIPSVPAASTCAQTGSSFTNWKDADHGGDLLEAGATNVSWTHEYNATYTPDRTQNIYHAHLNPYSYGQSNQSGTFGDAGVENLWERYGDNWYKNYNNGNLAGPMSFLNTEQLPTRTGGYSFAGYKTMDGYPRLNYADGRWNLMSPTTITDNEEWYAQWTQCTPGQYYLNGCQNCPLSHPNSDPTTATSMSDCYYSCSRCEANGCSTFGGAVCAYADPNSLNLNNGGVYYGTNTCVLLPGNTMPNCPYTVTSCAQGYQVNSNQTACEPIQTIVNYSCGTNGSPASYGVQMFNTATYGENYTVAQNDQNQEIQCTPTTTGYVLLLDTTHGNKPVWNLNYGTGQSDYTGHTFTWQYIFPYGTNPTFTAQYVCDTDNGYHQINGTCQQCPENSYWTESQCKQCDPGYHVNDAGNNCIPNTINLVYSTSCGTSNPSSATCTFDSGFNLATHSASAGYTFNGWTTPGTNNGPHAAGGYIYCTVAYLGNAVYTNNATVTITGSCASNNEQCPAQLPTNANLNINYPLNPTLNAGACTYHLQCASCIGSNDHDCYTYTGMNSDGTFTVNGLVGNSTVLNNVHCEPATYTAVYRCGDGTPTNPYYDIDHIITYNGSYTVLPNGSGGVVTCSKDGEMFNHWAFNLESGRRYNGGDPISPWLYHGVVPTFTAQYDQCPAGEVYVPSLGQCKEECYVPCKVPTNGACPNDFDLTPTSTGVHAYCGTYGGQAPNPQGPGYYLYPAPHVNEACLHVHTSNEITPQQCTDVSVVYCVDSNGTRSQHYTWDWDMHQCKPRTYSVTLNSNNGIGGSNFVDKLYEQYNVGWSRYLDGEFTSTLNLSQSELPTARETCKVFDGYYDVAGYRTISATGYLSLPATTLTDNTQVWNAHYVNDPNAYTITFQCSNGTVVSTQPSVVFNQGNVTAPVRSLCLGEAFTQWVSGNVTLNAGTIYPNWQYCSNMTFTPDVSNSAVWEVTLLPGDGTFDSNDIRKLYDAVNVGWYTNRDLSEQSRITQIDNDKVPTKQGANFVGYKNQNGDWRVNYSNGSGWDLPRTNDLSGHETWTAQYNLCQAGYYYQDGQCKPCPSGYTSDPTTATQQEHCYVQCETCVEPACPSIPHSTGCEFDHNNNENYPGYLFYSQNGQNKCVKRTFNYNLTETIMCNWCARCDEANGWIRDPNNCQVCVPSWQSNGHTINLNSLRMTDFDGDPTGDDVEPVRLYTWPDRGVYLDSGRTRLMTVGASGNNPVGTPTTYGVVRFDPNGGTVDLDGYRYTNRYGDRYVYANFRGFYNSQTGSTQYIDNSGHITTNGDDWGQTGEYDVTWYAKWRYGTIGEMPIPTRLGYTFDGWFDAPTGGNQVTPDHSVSESIRIFAHWERAKYYVNLDANSGQWGSDPVDKLWELYDTGWSTEQNGTFSSNLTLMESQRPSWPGNSKVFNGYWTAGNNGTQQIRADGSVVDTTATVLTVNNTTWYAQYVDNTNKYTITFRCSENASPIHTYRVSVGESITVPAKSECLNPGYSFTKWMGNQGTNFNARDSEYTVIWESFSDADFFPNWNNGDVYHVTLLQNDADAPGEVQDLYEKYGMWWALDQNNQYPMTSLSGDQLPTKTGYDFAGFKTRIGGYTRGDFDSESNVWVPQSNREITNDEEWVPKWTQCKPYWYYDNVQKICKECPAPYTNNEHPESLADCYDGRCELRCIERAIECPTDPNAIEFEYSNDVYSGTNYYQNHCVLDIWVQQGAQQEVIPSCECTIKTCKPGYHLVDGACVEYVKTDIMLNPNGGTWSSNVPSEYKYLYTIESTGVYRNSARTEEMTPTNGMALYAIPSNGVSITLNANGGIVTWGGGIGEILNRNAAFEFRGFYDSQTPGFAVTYILPQEINGETYAFITTGGQSAGMGYTTTPHTWYAQWNRSVTLPTPERQNYTFVGWTYNGELVSNSWTVPGNTANVTLIAQWTKNAGTIVTYNCNNEGGQGGNATDPTPAYIGETYTVLGNFIPCSKPATETTRAHEFENWQFNGGSYLPGYVFSPWSYTGSNPTFNAHYKECGDGYYFGSNGCQACPYGYPHSNIDATLPQHCYKNDCELPCVRVCPPVDAQEPGALACTYTTVNYTGTEYYEGSCNAAVQNCPWRVWCNEGAGYIPDANGEHCVRQDQYEITLDANGGTGGQEKLYTTYNTGVYLDQARTLRMRLNQNYLTDLPEKTAAATFNYCDDNGANCDGNPTTRSVSVDLGLKGYYQTAINNTRYLEPVPNIAESKLRITDGGDTAGQSYQDNTHTWYAQWSPTAIGNSRWPANPANHTAQCKTYTFNNWWTEPQGGNSVDYNTEISENVTWYAHWCESCPTGAIANGSCRDAGCVATFTCNNGYAWDETQCQCVAAGLTLTYQPNGGTPDVDYTEDRYFGETFTTRGGNTYTKVGHIIAKWANVGVGGGSFPLLAHSYTYDYNGNTTLEPEWKQCTCTFNGNSGVESCDADVVTNNTCTPDVVCKQGYVNGHYTCINEHLETCTAMCDICPAGTYQNGDQCSPCTGNNVSAAGATQCEPCDPGYTANTGHTQCVGNPITIDWDENGGRLVDNGICQFCTEGCVDITCESCGTYSDNTLTLANVTHSNPAMQFLGWKLFSGDDRYPIGTNVMCTLDNVGVTSGTSTAIQAQWNECQCSDQLNPHVVCQPVIVDDVCRHVYWCDSVGYNIVGDDYSNTSPYCDPKPFDVTYNCGVGATGTPLISADTATYDDTYIVKNAGGVNCQKVGFNFVGWLFDGDNYLHQADDRITWTYTSNKTFTAQYSQCAAGEVWVNGACEPCTCPQENWGAGVTQCVASPSSTSTCSALVSCNSGYYHPQGNCNGATCSAQCDQIQSNAIYVCGDGATGYAPATETMNYGDTHTVKGQASCAKSGYTFNGWNFTGTNGNYNPGATVRWNYGTDQTFTGNWCENCGNVANGTCSLNATFAGSCSYDCSCEPGYRLVGGVCTAHPVCEPDDSLTITYQPNDGMNNGVLGQPVIQNVTYGVGFITKPGTIFTKENSIITAWDHVEGGNYPELNRWYVYDTDIDTKLDAHWEQCTCDADNCTTYATDENKCACSGTCPTGYTYGGCNCNGTVCAPTCTQCAETEVSINNECVECECTPGAGAATCGTLSTIGNICEWTPSCLDRFVNVNANCTGIGNTTCNPTCTECPAGWISNAGHTECEECPTNTYQSGNTCVPCQNGYTSPAGSSSADACVPGAHTIHYLSNNGANETYNQGVYYGQSFVTEGGTRFTYTNHIMTHWNVESGASSTFTNGTATLSGNYVYNDTADTTLSAQWAQCTCDAPNCNTYATDLNTCACNATCPTGYTYGGCECDGTVCEPICTLGGSNAVYKCGTGIGTGYSTYVNYGDTHTILTNAFVGCYRDNSTFAGWAFNGDNNIYFDNVGATVRWDYTTDKEFEAKWCDNCSVVEHGTNQLTIPEPGLCSCVLTCDTGYHVNSSTHTCEPNVYPNENGITYKPNGGTPNRNYTQSVTYDAPFTTLGVVYSKARHILNSWDVESGGVGTFNGTAALNTTYTYHTDGATSLLAEWIECGINEISLDNRCQQCRCTDNNAGVTSCETSATNNDTCSCSGECAAGYINAGCNCNGTNCTQSCTKCADNQVSVNNVCEDCVCNVNDDSGATSCGTKSVIDNMCNWGPATCRPGYAYPTIICDGSNNQLCEASCTICPAGTYQDGEVCTSCPTCQTSLPGATSVNECFTDSTCCAPDEHIEHGECVSNTRACSIPDATSAVRIWNPAIGTYGPCTVEVDGCNSGYHVSGNVCVKDTEACTVEHGHGEHDWNGTSWGACGDVVCDPGYEPNSDYTACVECSNRRVNGDIAVSGYIYECEIATCMYQGQKYALQNGECVPICENASDHTGTKVWDERTKKCIRTCKPGYKMW